MPDCTFTVGRGDNNDLVSSRHATVSRQHLRLHVQEKGECKMDVLGTTGAQLFAGCTLTALAKDERVSLKGSGMVKCGKKLILGYVTAKVRVRQWDRVWAARVPFQRVSMVTAHGHPLCARKRISHIP